MKPRTIIVIEYNLFMLMRRMKIDFFKYDKYRTAGESLSKKKICMNFFLIAFNIKEKKIL